MHSSADRYYPYKKQATLFLPVWFACFGAFLLCLGFSSRDIPSVAVSVIAYAGTFLLWRYFQAIKGMYVEIINDELVFLDRGESTPQSRSIADFPYAYLARSAKGHAYLIFSMRSLDAADQRRLATQCSRTTRLLMEDAIIVYLDTSKQAAAFREKAAAKYPDLAKRLIDAGFSP